MCVSVLHIAHRKKFKSSVGYLSHKTSKVLFSKIDNHP